MIADTITTAPVTVHCSKCGVHHNPETSHTHAYYRPGFDKLKDGCQACVSAQLATFKQAFTPRPSHHGRDPNRQNRKERKA